MRPIKTTESLRKRLKTKLKPKGRANKTKKNTEENKNSGTTGRGEVSQLGAWGGTPPRILNKMVCVRFVVFVRRLFVVWPTPWVLFLFWKFFEVFYGFYYLFHLGFLGS